VASVRIKPDLSKFRKELAAGLKEIRAEVTVQVNADIAKAKTQIEAFVKKESGKEMKKKLVVDKESLKSAVDGLGGVATAANRVGIAALAFNAVMATAQAIGPLLAAASASALLLPGALAAAGAGLIAVKLGADGAKKAFKGLEPVLNRVKTSVSSSFEKALIPAVNNLKAVLPQLTGGFQQIVTAMGGALTRVTGFLKTTQGVTQTNVILTSTARVIKNVGDALAPITQIFIQLGAIAGPILVQMTSGFGAAANRLAAFVSSAQGIAKIQSLIKGSFAAFHSLGQILQQVGGIIVNFFTGLSLGAGNLGGSVLPVLTKINAALGSVQGQQALASLGAAMSALGSSIAQTIGPLIQKMLPAFTTFFNFIATHAGTFGPILVALGVFGGLAAKLAPVISTLFEVIGPLFSLIKANPILLLVGAIVAALGATGQLQPILKLVSDTFQQLATAIMPVLNSVFQALVQALTPIINAVLPVLVQLFQLLMPVISSIAGIIGGALVTVIQALAPPLLQIVQALLPPLLQIITALLPIITAAATLFGVLVSALAPLIGFLAKFVAGSISFQVAILAGILVPLAKLVGFLVGGVVNAITSVVKWFTNLGDSASSVGSSIGNFFKSIGEFFSGIGSKISAAFTAVVNFFVGLPAKIGSFLTSLPGVLLNAFLAAFKAAANAVLQGTEWVIAEMIALPFQIFAALKSLAQTIWGAFKAAFDFVVTQIPIAIDAVLTFFRNLPGQALDALLSLAASLGNFFVGVWNGAVSAISTGISRAIQFFKDLPGRAMSALSSLLSSIGSFFVSAWNNATSAIGRGVSNAIQFFKDLPGRALSALGNIGSLLLHSGEALINGFIQGIKNIGAKVAGVVSDILAKARSLLPFSPAKTGPFSGKGWTLYSGMALMQGLADGIAKNGGAPVAATQDVLSSLQDQLSPTSNGKLNAQISGAVSNSVTAAASFNPNPVNIVIAGDEAGLRQFISVEVEENDIQTNRRVKAGMG
jgi:phage-related protein